MLRRLKYSVLAEPLAVCRVADGGDIPGWARSSLAGASRAGATTSGFFSITRAPGEVSIVCSEDALARDREGIVIEPGWIALRLEGPFPFAMTGVLSSFIQPLSDAGIPVFAISTFDTDYVLIKNENKAQALIALGAAGHELTHGAD